MVTKKRDRMAEGLAKQILATGQVDANRVLYEKAFWDGAMSVLTRPENVEAEFNRLLKRLAEQEGDS